MTGSRSLVLPAVLLLGWLLLSTPHGLTGFDLFAGLAAAAFGALAGAVWPGLHRAVGRVRAAADDLLGDGDASTEAKQEGRAGDDASGDPARVDDRAAPQALEALLHRLQAWLGATRVVIWRLDREAGQLAVEHGVGPLPRAIRAAGSPLIWALEERRPVRLDPTPRWATGSAVVAPVDETRVLTVETPIDEPSDPDALDHAASILGPFLRLHDQQTHVVAATHRYERLVAYLGSLPRENDPTRAPLGLARSALDVVGGSGALVASWAGDTGLVLAREGHGGGPRPGDEFGVLQGDLAHAARTQGTLTREPAGGSWPALASAEEDWDRPPPAYRTVIPLVDPHGTTTGLLAVWGRTAPAAQGIALLGAVGPLLALQLRQAGDLEHFRERATVDTLTGLPNRAALEDRMAEEIARFHRHRRPVAALVLDVDHFKRVNDTHGHDAGDAVLRRVADVLRGAIRDVDFAARFGGEELVVLLPETMLHPALDVAERVRAAIEGAAIEHQETRIPVTASIGVSACPDCVEGPEALFASADQALYTAKEGGRNRVTPAPARVISGGTGG